MKHNTVLIVLSLLNALFFGLHLTGDIVFGIEKGGREILVGSNEDTITVWDVSNKSAPVQLHTPYVADGTAAGTDAGRSTAATP